MPQGIINPTIFGVARGHGNPDLQNAWPWSAAGGLEVVSQILMEEGWRWYIRNGSMVKSGEWRHEAMGKYGVFLN